MNWNKIALISCWAALIIVIGAASGYSIYGPSAPFPHLYVSPTDEKSSASDLSLNVTLAEPNSTAEEEPVGEDVDNPNIEDVAGTDPTPSPTDDQNKGEEHSTSETSEKSEEEITDKHDPIDEHNQEEPTTAEDKNHEEIAPPEEQEITSATNNDKETTAETVDNHTTAAAVVPVPQKTQTAKETEAPVVASHTPPQDTMISPASNEPSWKLYGKKPPEADGRPRIAIVLTGLGLSRAATEAAIRQLPSTISLSFTPYARDLESWIALARSRNHEVLLDLPMEPLTYPSDDPGPQALLTGRQPEGNLNNLAWIANRGSGYVGMSAYMGDRFVTSARQMKPVMEYFKDHGLLFLDNGRNNDSLAVSIGAEIGVPVAINQRALDEAQLSRGAINARLAQVERIALKNGFAIATGRPFPVTLERIAHWVNDLDERGFQLVPITAVIDVQETMPAATEATPPKHPENDHSAEDEGDHG